jgi:hypothetical protein
MYSFNLKIEDGFLFNLEIDRCIHLKIRQMCILLEKDILSGRDWKRRMGEDSR